MPKYTEYMDDIWPPCSDACPAGTDVRGYIRAVSEGRYEDAFEIIRVSNPFGSACGRICPHACEQNCRRNDVDEPVAARSLKRYVYEQVREYRKVHRSKPDIPLGQSGKRVAIVGAGPAGMSAARDLALMGHTVEVFEREEKAGGMLMNAIPDYRLPRDTLEEDINAITGLGIKLNTKKSLGEDFTVESLQNDGFDAVILALGLQESHSLPLPGIDAQNVLLALPFLRALARGERPDIGKDVIVIGGGNVAMDVARSAKRLGADTVTCVCLESMDILPASPWEVEEAEEEGVNLRPSWGPKCIETENGAVCGLTCQAVERVFDEEGRFAPTFFEDQLTEVAGDTLILAIGQRADLDWAEGSGIDYQGFRLMVDPETLATSMAGVFACGEVARGPGSAIQAVDHGRKAAWIVNNYLETGETAPFPEKSRNVVGRLDEAHAGFVTKEEREPIVLMGPEERLKGFMDYESPYSEAQAMHEARRCMNCGDGAYVIPGKCALCLTCQRVCPFGVPVMGGHAALFPEEFCVACGMCYSECPGNAIVIRRFLEDRSDGEVEEYLSRAEDRVVRFTCRQTAMSRQALETGDALFLDCLGTLSHQDLLRPFELGASRVVIESVKEHECKNGSSVERLLNRIKVVNEQLAGMGFEDAIVVEES